MKKIVKTLLASVLCMMLFLSSALADTYQETEVTPEKDDLSMEQAVILGKEAIQSRFDFSAELLDFWSAEAKFVTYNGKFGHVDDTPLWVVAIGEFTAVMDRNGTMIGVDAGRREIAWDSDTLLESQAISPLPQDGTEEQAIAKALECLPGLGLNDLDAHGELLLNPYFCYGSEPVWLVTFSQDETPQYKALLRWDMEFIDAASWGKEFRFEGYPLWIAQKDEYFPHGVGFEGFTLEEQAAFSQKYRPIVDEMEKINPHLKDDPYNQMYWLTRHVYGVPGEDTLSLKAALEIVKEACEKQGATPESYSTRHVSKALDITDPDQPIWRFFVGYDFSMPSNDWYRYAVGVDARSGEIIYCRSYNGDAGAIPESEIW